ncbi:hypothetical protein NXC14_CH00585 [Rhizobium sp. NXC14]|uniref:hypothetical protein n=1 Tax=Rhizobium sp. NXC14 TaxID=1981173 RepID=UPI000A205FC5|nr:hypothetical protein [Rhizobium sp. NXC14]ARO28588.1 hypothetical protein NXC14_CH00585 [Rhizobium sp. NXC14]
MNENLCSRGMPNLAFVVAHRNQLDRTFRKPPLIGGFRLWRLHCRAGRRPFGLDAKTYCDKTAPIYRREFGNELRPERCADQDAAYWP